MAENYSFYGRTVSDSGVYSYVLSVGNAKPTPDGENALVLIAEGINGPKFGEVVAVSDINYAKMILGDQGPAIEACHKAFNPTSALTGAQDVRIINPRALVQATGTIKTTGAGDDSITVKSRIYGPIGNGVKIKLDTKV
ncbi:MAG: hypothetical protein GY866_26920, partial [Proteobacteria bacterium]|nr:hypothetical protein [Pseudomonadota bacterium]